MARLETELETVGCDMDPQEFRETVCELHAVMHPVWTDEELLVHPHDALRFCATVRSRVKCDGLPDPLILRTLMNARKRNTETA